MKNKMPKFKKGDIVLVPLEYVHRGKAFNPHDQIKMVTGTYFRLRTYIDDKGRSKTEKLQYVKLQGHTFYQELMSKEVEMFIPRLRKS